MNNDITTALFALHLDKMIESNLPAPKPVKICRVCGKEHQHNNMYCSAECCKEDK